MRQRRREQHRDDRGKRSMRVEMAYRSDGLDVFDTMSFTASTPLGKENALSIVSQVDDAMPPELVAECCGCSEELVY